MLRARTRIEAHDEVVAVVVCRLQFLGRLGEQESAPVGDAAHNALLVEYDLSGGFGDSKAIESQTGAISDVRMYACRRWW